MQKSLQFWIASGIALGSLATTSPASAQPVPDATLPVNSVVTTQGNSSIITGGTRAGRNLFHSFRKFSVPTLGVAYFNNALDIQNVISRVTGASVSNINGLIKANGAANLFLINPQGIMFGPHASLNIGGSFLASTANSLKFADGTQFSATATEATPLLTMGVPIGLQLGTSAGSITNRSTAVDSQGNRVGLQVLKGNNLTLVGGNVSLDGGNLTAAGGRVDLGGLSQAGMVGLNPDGSLSFPVGVTRGDVSLTNALVDVTTANAGSIDITARNIDLQQQSRLRAGIRPGLGAVGSKAGDVTLSATNAISLSQASQILNQVFSNATGDSGDINVTTGALSLTDGSLLSASTLGQGNAGNVNIQVGGDITFDGFAHVNGSTFRSGAISAVGRGARGKAGDITIAARSLSLSNGAQLSSSIYPGGQGNAGKVSVQTDGDISLAGDQTIIFSSVESGAVGNGGTIDIKSTAGSLKVIAGAELITVFRGAVGTSSSSTPAAPGGRGNAGSINIQIGKDVIFDGVGQENAGAFASGADSNVDTDAQGNAGDITIAARSLSLTNGAQLTSSTLGRGNAGNISVQTDGDIFLAGDQTTIFSSVESGAVGNGGTIDIKSTAGSLKVTAGAQLDTIVREAVGTSSSSTPAAPGGRGNAGSINIQVGKDVIFDGVSQENAGALVSGAFSDVKTGARGNGGDITIAARSLSLSNGAQLISSTAGTGNAGSVNINAGDGVSLDRSSVLSSVASGGMGNGGGINITAGSLSLTNGAQLKANTSGQGNAGSVNINARNSVSFEGTGSDGSSSGVYTQSNNRSGINDQAGNITVNTTAFRITNGAVVTSQTSSPSGGGNVIINAKTFEVNNGGQVLTSTASSGKAGNIVLHVTDSVTLSGSDPTYVQRLQQFGPDFVSSEGASSGLFANTDNGSTGQGGTISIDPIKLTIANGAEVAVGSLGQGQAGNISVQARAITLDHGFVSATAASVNGGNIFVQAPESLLLRHGSQISATAGTANGGGNGGNISIDNTALIIAFPTEGSNISANAFKGNGGQVQINAAGIFGLQSQPTNTSLSAITASSTGGGIKGVVNLNTLNVDPSRGLVALPVILADTSKQIAQGCAAGNGTTGSRFVVTGRGGLPSNPSEPLSSEAVWSDTRFVAAMGKPQHSRMVSAPQPSASAAVAIVPATGWVFNSKGDVTLTAAVPSERIQVPWLTPASCQAR